MNGDRLTTTKPTQPEPSFTDPDLVDRIFEYLLAEFPQIAGPRLEESKRAVRDEFRGARSYIASRGPTERQQLAQQVLSLFDGRNASEVARRLQIGRTTVYRLLKQSGAAKTSSTFAVNGTGKPVRSKPSEPTAAALNLDTTWPSPKPISTPSTPPLPAAN